MMNSQGPMPRVLHEGAEQLKGELSRMSSIVGALAVADLVRSTLGPKGMDKILQSQSNSQSVEVTNDGATILKSVVVDNPAAKILIDISRVQDDEIGDGTTSVCVVAGELLREAEKLMHMHIHPQTIIDGWRLAVKACRGVLDRIKVDATLDMETYRRQLVNIAKTTLSSKLLHSDRDHFANLAVDAILRLDKENPDLDLIYVLKKPGGSIRDSFLAEGFILDKKIGVGQPKRVENPRVLVANTPMDTDKIKIYGAQVKTDSIAKMAEIEKAERAKMVEKCKKIIGHNVNVFVNRQLIYDLPEQEFTDAGMCSIEHADFDGIERIAAALGGEIVSTFDHPELVKVGQCKLMEEVIIGEDTLVRFSGVPAGSACTIVLRGASSQVLEEAERSLHDALCVLLTTVKSPYTICGGGASEMEMALECDKLAKTIPGKKALAIEAYSHALRQIPKIISDNAGYDSTELVAQLQAAHAQGQINAGLDVRAGRVVDMMELGVHEAFRSKLQVVISASEAAEQILRVDQIVRCAPRQRGGHGH